MTEQMKDVDHTNPHTDETFGAAFQRGPDVAADGGRADAERTDDQMSDVDHEPPEGEGANPAFERGTEGRADSV